MGISALDHLHIFDEDDAVTNPLLWLIAFGLRALCWPKPAQTPLWRLPFECFYQLTAKFVYIRPSTDHELWHGSLLRASRMPTHDSSSFSSPLLPPSSTVMLTSLLMPEDAVEHVLQNTPPLRAN